MDRSVRADDVASQLADPALLAALRRDMLRFARLHLRDSALAEDAVQESIEAALVGVGRYAGQASLKTWVFGILRHKIVDLLRRGCHTVPFSSLADADDVDELVEALFRASGHWQAQARPAAWAEPEAALVSKQFWAVFEACLSHLPESVARVFTMREMLELDTAEICTQLAISANNCHVILYRARTRLRECLERNWFVEGEERPC